MLFQDPNSIDWDKLWGPKLDINNILGEAKVQVRHDCKHDVLMLNKYPLQSNRFFFIALLFNELFEFRNRNCNKIEIETCNMN